MPPIKDTRPSKFCAAQGCKASIGDQYLMCVTHWRLVPTEAKRQVYRTWRCYCNAPDRNASLMALRRYRAAVDAAIAAVAAKPFNGLQATFLGTDEASGPDIGFTSTSNTTERGL